MKYFIDFEATQFSNEIISVGCIREDGETFYSLVAPVAGKLTPFITNMTQITEEMLAGAFSADEVFTTFYDWAFADENDVPEFYCYGNGDAAFLYNTSHRAACRKAKIAMGYICGNVIDFHHKLCKRAEIKSCSLIGAYHTLCGQDKTQNHNALDDAVLLFDIYKAASALNNKDLQAKMKPFYENKKPVEVNISERWSQQGLPKGTICIIDSKQRATNVFANVDEAYDFLFTASANTNNQLFLECPKETITDRILKTCNQNKKYFSHVWRRVV